MTNPPSRQIPSSCPARRRPRRASHRPRPPQQSLTLAGDGGCGGEPTYAEGTLSLYHGDTKVGEGKIKTQLGFYAIAGERLYVGRQPGEPVTEDYPGESPHTFTGGTLKLVAVNVSGKPFTDLEHHAAMLLKHQ